MNFGIVGILLDDHHEINGFYVAKIDNNGSINCEDLKCFSEEDIINKIKRGHSVCTALWDYRGKQWIIGSPVHILGTNLRSNANKTLIDNLYSLPHFY